MTRPFTLIAALIFAFIAVIHVYRLFTDFQIIAGSHTIPMWVSYVGVVVPGLIAFMLFREARS